MNDDTKTVKEIKANYHNDYHVIQHLELNNAKTTTHSSQLHHGNKVAKTWEVLRLYIINMILKNERATYYNINIWRLSMHIETQYKL